MKKLFCRVNLILIILMLGIFVLAPLTVRAVGLSNAIEETGSFAKILGYDDKDPAAPEVIVGRIISYTLSFLGVVFFVLMVFGGWKWLLAKGNEEEIAKAKSLIIHSIIGLIIVFSAYLISTFVVSAIIKATSK